MSSYVFTRADVLDRIDGDKCAKEGLKLIV